MVVHVVYRRRENSWRGADSSVRFLGASMSSNQPSKHQVRLAGRGGIGHAPTSPTGGRKGGLSLRATSPPPPTVSIASVAAWDSIRLRLDGEEGLKEFLAAGDKAAGVEEEAAVYASEWPAGGEEVTFDAPPTDEEVHAAVASIQQVFENPSGEDSDGLELQALALPIAGLPSSGMFVNYFTADSDASEKQTVQISNLGNSPSNIGLDDCTEPAALALNSTALMTREHQNVLDAFQLLQEDASVQKMVMALSTDKAVWDAVMNNEVVQEFKKSFQDAKETDTKGSSSAPPGMMQWVLENTQAKIKEFLEKILQLVHTVFQAQSMDYDLSDDVVRMSFMLSVFVFIVVTIARIK